VEQGIPVIGFGLMCVFGILGLAATVFWLWMLIDALTHEPTTNDKILWFLVIFFLHFIGALIYLLVRRSQRGKPL
jgi:Phospholipase_D-nuclease N-terminal